MKILYAILVLLAMFSPVRAELNTSELHNRILAVAPINGVSIGDPAVKATWVIQFKAAATTQQRADAQVVIDNWTSDDWGGTLSAKKSAILEKVIVLHMRRAAMTVERDYWAGAGSGLPGATARVNALNALLLDAQNQIDVLRPQG